jgi:outer membrane protein insertion porin family
MIVLLWNVLARSEQPRVRSIHISGAHAFPLHQLFDAISLTSSGIYSAAQLSYDEESILGQYHHKGYYLATVTDSVAWSNDSSGVEITLDVEEGPQAAIGGIDFSGNITLSSKELLEHFETRPGGYLDTRVLEHDLLLVISRYERIGYPFARAEVKSIDLLTEAKLVLHIQIEEGTKIIIDEIRVAGNKETAEQVIVREARVNKYEPYNEDKVAKISRRLSRLNIFSAVSEPQIYQNAGGGGLLITVREGNTNTFDGIIGYVPGTTGDVEGFVTGMVNVSMRNLFGTARKLNVRWQRDERQSQEIAVQYTEPWLFNLPVNMSGNFFQRQQDTMYVRRVVDVKGELPLFESVSLGGILTLENIIPSITSTIVSESRTLTTGIELRYDSRDDILSPTSGAQYRSGYHIGRKNITGVSLHGASTVQKINLDAEFYTEPVTHQVVAFGLHGKQTTGDNIELGDQYRLGGTTTLRGYRENQFLGSRIAWTNTEYRFLLARRSFFYGFFDTGYFYLPVDDAKSSSSVQQFKYGYGIGIRLETSLGNIGVSVALGEGDGIGQTKLHVGLINDF